LAFFSFTFDDGNLSQIRDYYPILKKYGFPATFYVTASEIDSKGKLSSKDLLRLVSEKNEVGSHGWTHRPLMRLSLDRLREELQVSHELLEPFHVSSFAYPYGKYDERVVREVARCYDSARGHSKKVAANNIRALHRYSLLSFTVDGKSAARLRSDSPEYLLSNRDNFQSDDWVIVVLHGPTSINPAGIKILLRPLRFTPEQVRGTVLDIRARVSSGQRAALRDFEVFCAGLVKAKAQVRTVSGALEHFA
jgi:peptidoglycan/xylan/chitin deacetylase (PgdA/CDA1 family)